MTENYTHSLTDIEIRCGITLDDVADMLPKVLLIDDGQAVVFPENTSAALASSTARCAFAGTPAEFSGFNQLHQPVYRQSTDAQQ